MLLSTAAFFIKNSPVSLWLLVHVPSLSVRVHLLSQSIVERKKKWAEYKKINKAVLRVSYVHSMHEKDYPLYNKDKITVEWDSSQKYEKYDQNSNEWMPFGRMAGGWIGWRKVRASFSNGMALAIKWLIHKNVWYTNKWINNSYHIWSLHITNILEQMKQQSLLPQSSIYSLEVKINCYIPRKNKQTSELTCNAFCVARSSSCKDSTWRSTLDALLWK